LTQMDANNYDPIGYWLCPLFYFESDKKQIQVFGECRIEDYRDPEASPVIKEFVKTKEGKSALQLRRAYATKWILMVPHSQVVPQHKNLRNTTDDPSKINSFFVNLFTAFRLCHSGLIIPRAFSLYLPSSNTVGISVSNYLCGQYDTYYVGEEDYKLAEADIPVVSNLFEKISKYRENKRGLDIAIGRFHSSYVDGDSNDKLIDQMIAFESLYIGDNKELGYKLALRTASLLEKDQGERKVIFSNMKRAYNLRGNIVHGSNQVERRELKEIIPKTEEYLRQSIRKFLALSLKYPLDDLKKGRDKKLAILDENILKNGDLLDTE